jgi:hypothetical protein
LPGGESHLAPLQISEQVEYDRVLYLQPYTLLRKSLDAIWAETAARQARRARKSTDSEANQPVTYLFASVSLENKNLDSGLWLVRPDQNLSRYYQSLANTTRLYHHDPLQAVLSDAHRPKGNMPWARLSGAMWSCRVSGHQVFPSGCVTVHNNFGLVNNPGLVNAEFLKLWWETQRKMRAFWKDAQNGKI